MRACDDTRAASVLDRTVEWLLGLSRAADKGVRFRCCQLLGGMTTAFIERHEDDFDRVVDVLLPRLQDKVKITWFCVGAQARECVWLVLRRLSLVGWLAGWLMSLLVLRRLLALRLPRPG